MHCFKASVRTTLRGHLILGEKRFVKILLFAVAIAVASVAFGVPAFAAVKLGTAHLVQLAGSPAFESTVLALLGTAFLTVASAVRRLQASAKQSLS